jgi:pimeloyl-ACP methyl ester carboxylesterase
MNQAKQTDITTAEPQLLHVVCPGASTLDAATHRMACWSWGDVNNKRTLLCVHGLSRQGRDFDVLARRLSSHYHVVCPDVVGRGQSDWLADAKGYQVFSYASDMMALGQMLRAAKGLKPEDAPLEVDWVGTSMGGLIGLGFSSLPPEASGLSIRRMVLNDVGPRLRIEALLRIGSYLGLPKVFAAEQEAAEYLWSISTGFGPHTDQQWLDLCRPLLKAAPDGAGLVLRYDPAIAEPFKAMTAESATAGEAMVWQVYDNLKAETLLLRGENSDLLDATTAQEMTQRGPKARLISFAGVGHAPTLIAEDQVSAVEGFLLA